MVRPDYSGDAPAFRSLHLTSALSTSQRMWVWHDQLFLQVDSLSFHLVQSLPVTSSACTTSPTSSTEIVYGPSGTKLALMNGSTLTKAFVSLPGGVQAVYNSSGLQYYRHPDWLGSSRLSTTTSRTKYYDVAYAPFGEPYAGSGTQDLSFTGQNQDTESSQVPGGAGGLYDFLYREHSPVQGRWLSPDPSGIAAANPSDPQSWNRYAYVGNRPLNSVDSLGLCGGDDPNCGCDPLDPSCGCDPNDPTCGPPPYCGLECGPIYPPSLGGWAPSPNGNIDPNKETTNLPSGLDTPSTGLDNLLSLLPGLNLHRRNVWSRLRDANPG
jgi:RHS repeat-associated protein